MDRSRPTATGPWYEIQGLFPCPANDHPNTHCSVPDEGQWLPIYSIDNEAHAKRILAMVVESEDPMYDRCEDFRIAVPDPLALKKKNKITNARAKAAGRAA